MLATSFLDLASTYAAIVRGNQSANGTAVQQQWYPPLPGCNDPMLNPAISCPGPNEAMSSALVALRTRVQGPCLTCAAYVFQPLGSIDDQNAFFTFLNRAPGMYDGARSKMPYSQICTLGSWNGILCSGSLVGDKTTVADHFRNSPGLNAISQMPAKNGLLVFFNASSVCGVYSSQFSGFYNQSRLFHESLHGFYGKSDSTIQQAFGLAQSFSVNITNYIQQKVFGGIPSACGN
jgi:hypothetical protein